MKRVAIMQPTFLPWLGYFALLDAVDEFVYLDDVQLSRQSWQTRNRIAASGGVLTLSLDVARKPSRPTIAEARLAADTGRRRKLLRTVAAALAGAPHGPLVESLLEAAFDAAGDSLATLNITLIEAIAACTGIDTARRRASGLDVPPMEKSTRLLAICRRLGADEYLSPIGSADYLAEADPFAGSEVALRLLDYEHPRYRQAGDGFESHLAAIDALAWVGPEAFLPLARSGMRRPLALAEVTTPRALAS